MAFRPIPDDEAQAILQGMEQAEKDGFFNRMFTEPCRQPAELPTKENFMRSVRPDMRLFKSFFLKLYGYSLTDPDAVPDVLERLREAGCTKGEEYYLQVVREYRQKQEEEQKKVTICKSEQKEGEERRTMQAEVELLKRKRQLLMQKSQILTDS